MELRLTVETPGHPEQEIAIDVRPDHRVGEATAALVAHLELTGRCELYSRRSGSWLDPAMSLAAADLRTGDRVWVGDPMKPPMGERAARQAPVDLLVVGGPDAGRRFSLTVGEHRVGSFRYSSVLLDDPLLSRIHLNLSVSPAGVVQIRDGGSETGTFVAGEAVTGIETVKPGDLIVAGGTVLELEAREAEPAARAQVDASGRIAFNRPPRVIRLEPARTVTLEAPPQKEKGHRLPLSTAIVPLAMGLVMFAFMHNPMFLLFMLLTPVMAAFSFLETGIGGRRQFKRGTEEFHDRMRAADRQLGEARVALAQHLRATSPDLVRLLDRAQTLDPALWERRPDDLDWLLLRVGWADQALGPALEVATGGEDSLREEAEKMAAGHRMLHAAPLRVSLREAGVLGVSGESRRSASLARALGMQLAALHSPEDLVLAAAVPDDERADWAWLGWLPHCATESASRLAPCVVSGRTAARALVDRLLSLLAERRQARDAYHGTSVGRLGASVVVFLHERAELPRGATAQLLQQGPGVGIHAIWLGGDRQSLPGECGAVVDLQPAGTAAASLILPGAGASVPARGVDGASVHVADALARALAPVRDVSARESQAGIPRRVELMELLGLQGNPQARIMSNWIADRSAPHLRTLRATLGVAAGGQPVDLSLREDGPHALMGGMTGSGKSELLQSLVASLAVSHSSRSLTFLLVDYKGGSAFKDCVELPQTVGFVTDLDGHLVNRALVSLRAELRRREEILRHAGAKDLLDLERRDPDRTPPSLLIVVDEFAALAAELPEFVDGMVDVAQRGRSLGIHLLLATQRPQGVINDKIRANTNLRLSLRFSDDAESTDVIGTKDAARPGLPPGRAFARIGPGEVVEFQAGYVGGRAVDARGPAPVTVRALGFAGAAAKAEGPRPSAAAAAAAVQHEPETDLMRLVASVQAVDQALGLPRPSRPWLPTLPELIPLDDLPTPKRGRAALGLIDDPAGQRQLTTELDLDAEGNLLIYGTSGSGKTTLLRALATSAALAASPAALHIYGLDFATRGLRSLEALPHCGGVISGDEPERVIRLLGMLRAESDRRKKLLASSGAATVGEHLASGRADPLPTLLVLLDGYPGFISALENVDIGAHVDAFRELVAEGRPLGIAFAIATDRQAGYLTSLSASIVRRVVLRMASDDEYSLCGVPRSLFLGAHLPPGRGFTESGYELQCGMVGKDPSGAGQAAAVAAIGARLRERHGEPDVAPVRLLPSRVERGTLPPPDRPLEAVVGIDDRRLEPLRIDLEEGHFIVAGPRRSGRSTALAAFAASLAASPRPPELNLLAPRRQSRLPELGVWTSVAVGLDDCTASVERLAAAARTRRPDEAPTQVLVIDDGEELADAGLSDLDWIAQRGVEHGLRILVGAETQSAQRVFSGWMTLVLRERQGILLDADPAIDGTMLGGVQLPRRRGVWPAGRAYLVRRGVVDLVQIAT
ncbi:MAG TPA: FtsK/SpoIIIE domain-containing protein [Candidatus Dormibacteraeota bacterium]